jgi:Ni/Fe-hydrogenase subunit HybB-like protein
MATLRLQLQRVHITPLRLWFAALAAMILIGLYGASQVFMHGLQVTSLTDRVPWGLWITIDLSSIALGAGAFTFSAVVYIFRLKRFESVARPAVFVGFLGYTSAMIALVMDIGRPDRFWHPLIFWNVHSVLWEITWCVVLYSTVLFLEFLPMLLEIEFFSRWPRLRQVGHLVHRATPVLAVVGLGLSLLHQSSLGATYAVLAGRSIWFKPSLPVLFILSAIGGGIALTLLTTIVTGKLRNMQLIDRGLKGEVSRLLGFVMLAYLYLKLWDWAATSYYSHAPGTVDVVSRLNAITPFQSAFWWLEMVFGALLPAVVFLAPRFRKNDRMLMLASGFVVLGVVVNRWNTTLSGLIAPPDWSPGILHVGKVFTYLPSVIEIAVGIGILGYALISFTLGSRFLPIFNNLPKKETTES